MCPVPKGLVAILRSIAAVVGGYVIVAAGTILTFNVLLGQVTINSGPLQLVLGTVGAVCSGFAGGMIAGIVAPKFPFRHAAAVLIFLVIDTASVLAKGPGPVWFDLAGSSILAVMVVLGGWIIAHRRGSGGNVALQSAI